MSTENFYSDLPPLHQFSDITKAANFVSVPNDWYILVTDIIQSTKAIEQGRYKDVNLLGACSIIAVLNVAQQIGIPFIFGGDGASILIPPMLYSGAKKALLALQELAETEFNLLLRVGIVPVADVMGAKYTVKAAKLEVSENYDQAIFIGGGLTYATELVKAAGENNLYQLKQSEPFTGVDLSGLECRWQDIPSKHEEILSLIVMETGQAPEGSGAIYQKVIQQIEKIYGDALNYHPVSEQNLNFTLKSDYLIKQSKLLVQSRYYLAKILYLWRLKVKNLVGLFLIKFKIKSGGIDWGLFKQMVAKDTDYRKFDDMLRMVMSGSAQQREKLVSYLEAQYKAGSLVYGIHVSDRALMTCVVFEHKGSQVHFIDGADGGYALAAKAMKARMQQKGLDWETYIALKGR